MSNHCAFSPSLLRAMTMGARSQSDIQNIFIDSIEKGTGGVVVTWIVASRRFDPPRVRFPASADFLALFGFSWQQAAQV